MPAYISVDCERLKPSCGEDGCDQMEHWTNVQIGPAILEPVEVLLECMTESHADEVATNHHGDGARGCTYCRAIKNVEKMLKGVKGKNL